MDAVADATMRAMEYALRGLGQRADVRSHNLANLNTPGFRATRVDFEGALRAALAGGRPERAAAPTVEADPSYPNAHGSTVSLENEMVGMIKDNLLRDAIVNAYTFKANVIRTAVTSR